jgi:hypothetical protein
MNPGLNGVQNVAAIEKQSGLSKYLTIVHAWETNNSAEIATRKRPDALYLARQGEESLHPKGAGKGFRGGEGLKCSRW